MRTSTAVRSVAAVLLALVAPVALALGAASGCSTSGSVTGAADAGEDLSVGPVEAGGQDGPLLPDVDAGSPVVAPLLYFVNASPDGPPLRFCIGTGTPGDGGAVVVPVGLNAMPDQPTPGNLAGLYEDTGFGMPLPQGVDLDLLTFDVFALDAANGIVAANNAAVGGINDAGLELTCEGLIGSDGLGTASDAGGVLQPGRDYWNLGTFQAGALGHGTTWLMAVAGCVAGETNAATLCPSGYDAGAGDLQLLSWSLDTTTQVDAGAIGAQLVQASSEWDDLAHISGGALSAGFVLPGDAGVVVLATDAGFGALQPATLALAAGITYDGTTSFFAQVTGAAGDAGATTSLTWTLPAVQGFSWPDAAPASGVLRDGAGFAFVLVGNPAAALGTGHGARVLALPVGNP
jgi:hypothetical protein